VSAAFPKTEWIWHNGEYLRWDDATLHVMSHVVHYGSSVFEGIRGYETPRGLAIFRLAEHLTRLRESASIYRMTIPHSSEELAEVCHELSQRNGLSSCYIRPLALRGVGAAGLNPGASPVETYVIAWGWGAYLGPEALELGVEVRVSSWYRPAANTFPAIAKAGGNYLNGQLMKMEAVADGYDEAIALSVDGTVSEGSGQNLFMVRDGLLLTPEVDGSFLRGITRDSVMRIAEDLGIEHRESTIPREALYTADELFFAGTASEVTPIRSVDRIEIGPGRRGPVTEAIQARFLGIACGEIEDERGWLDYGAGR
jgi:branched-chain amino acid aminotransferase